MAAVHGIDVVLRHSFFDYGYTHLVDQHFNPFPVSVYFTSLIHMVRIQNNKGLTGYAQDKSAQDPVHRWHLSLFPVGAIS